MHFIKVKLFMGWSSWRIIAEDSSQGERFSDEKCYNTPILRSVYYILVKLFMGGKFFYAQVN